MIFTIAQHELGKLFKTGKIWKLLALTQFILGLIFYWLTEEFFFKGKNALIENITHLDITEEVIHPLFAWTALLFFLITPLIATNSLTQERKNHLLELYLTSPLSSSDIILGKFFGIFSAQLFLLLPVVLMPLLSSVYYPLDMGQVLVSLFGLMLLLSATLSLGLFVSSLSKEPLLAALAIFIILLVLAFSEWIIQFLDPSLHWITEFSLLYHCKNFLSGLINTRDIIYYCLFSIIFLNLGIYRLQNESRLTR